MATNGPYYQQAVQSQDQNVPDEYKIAQGAVEYGVVVAPQASMYPDPDVGQVHMPSDYHAQQQHHQQQQHMMTDNDAEDHAQLQGLVEAATSAAAQEQIRQAAFAAHSDLHTDPADQELVTLLRENTRTSKRRRSLSLDEHGQPYANGANAASERAKRQKQATSQDQESEDNMSASRSYHNPLESPHHLDARAAGVHSAAALFRPPSDSSKKYTRPPMSKLFTSLELSPENFLYLQAAAKQYMLDPDHPERQACVGNRGRGDSDMVKLRLHHCVREFLDGGGWGEKYFGENAPPPGEGEAGTSGQQRQFVWPRDKDRIIALCTPLLRRMVTNERQRQYAVETRKGGKTDHQNGDGDGHTTSQTNGAESFLPNSYDPRLNQGPITQIYLLDNQTKQPLRDRIDSSLDDSVDFPALLQSIAQYWCEAMGVEQPPQEVLEDFYKNFSIQVLVSTGLTSVAGEGEWQLACQDARHTVWLDGVVKVVVECAAQS